MAIAPICDRCGKELKAFGALLFSPPDSASTVKKFHVCVDCYAELVKEFNKTAS